MCICSYLGKYALYTQNDLNQLSYVTRMYAETQDHRYSSMRCDNGLKPRLYVYTSFEAEQKISILTRNMWISLRQLAVLEQSACVSNCFSLFWPVSVFIVRGPFRYKKVFLGFLHGKKMGNIGLDRPLGLHEVEAPRISRQSVHEGAKFVSHMHWLALPPGDYPVTHFWHKLSWPQHYSVVGRTESVKIPSDPIENRIHDIPTSSAVPEPTAPLLQSFWKEYICLFIFQVRWHWKISGDVWQM
jgi:hypothetical protein